MLFLKFERRVYSNIVQISLEVYFIHEDDKTSKTSDYEHFFSGEEVINLNDEMKMIPVPGNTKGSVVYLFQNRVLFTGDHLAFSRDLGHLYAFKTACWYDFASREVIAPPPVMVFEMVVLVHLLVHLG